MKTYTIQHNGKAKNHLVDDDLNIICGCKSSLDFTDTRKLRVDGARLFEVSRLPSSTIEDPRTFETEVTGMWTLEEFCGTCLKKAIRADIAKRVRLRDCDNSRRWKIGDVGNDGTEDFVVIK